jgi:hypothetical protein
VVQVVAEVGLPHTQEALEIRHQPHRLKETMGVIRQQVLAVEAVVVREPLVILLHLPRVEQEEMVLPLL